MDSVLSWAVLLVAGYAGFGIILMRAINREGFRKQYKPQVSKVYTCF